MTSIKSLIKRHKSLTYFILTFIISWSGILILAISNGIPISNERFTEIGPIAMLPFVLGPGLVSLILAVILWIFVAVIHRKLKVQN